MTNPPQTPIQPTPPAGNTELLDAAALEALGINTPEESDAFVLNLAHADKNTRRQARELRETVAQLAAASPFMEPSAKLRDGILAATLPANYKLADYKKKGEISPRFLRWGLTAAVLFLTVSAFYNNSLRTQIQQQQQQIAGIGAVSQKQGADLSSMTNTMSNMSKMMINPTSDQITLTNRGQVIGKALVDDKNGQALLILPKSMQTKEQQPQFSIVREGKRKTYKTLVWYVDNAPDSPGIGLQELEIREMKVENKPSYTAPVGNK